ncbi:MAG TPA: hypothetical protein VK427_07440 [Kofleriaceae bacterium]|nr:hypothetical protein [Kofleriaceae bacterium]
MTSRYDQLVANLRAEFPRLRIVRKDHSLFQRAIHVGLVAITLGSMRRYLDSFQTTIGTTVYVTPDWDSWPDERRYVTMRHEAIHLRQFRRYTLPGMALCYLLLPFPMGFAWCRARLEQEAYAETIRAAAEVHGVDYPRGAAFRDGIIAQFTGPSYGWMWPFRSSLEAWYDRVLATLEARG